MRVSIRIVNQPTRACFNRHSRESASQLILPLVLISKIFGRTNWSIVKIVLERLVCSLSKVILVFLSRYWTVESIRTVVEGTVQRRWSRYITRSGVLPALLLFRIAEGVPLESLVRMLVPWHLIVSGELSLPFEIGESSVSLVSNSVRVAIESRRVG